MQGLYQRLLKDIQLIGINTDFKLELKLYSKLYFGNYNPNTNKIVLYLYQNPEHTKMYSYKDLLFTFIHELCHCIQWQSKDFVRYYGLAHDAEFYKMYNFYTSKAESLIFRDVTNEK